MATKSGVTDTALAAERFIATAADKSNNSNNNNSNDNNDNNNNNNNDRIDYIAFCEEWIAKGYSPIFEWCSSASPIVLKYTE